MDNRTDICEGELNIQLTEFLFFKAYFVKIADIDECKYEPCDIRYAICLNLNGTYICKCKPGYNVTKSTDVCLCNITYL